MQKDQALFISVPVRQAVAKLAIPTVILYSLVNTFFVGQIGDPNQLAALSITFPDFHIAYRGRQSFRYRCKQCDREKSRQKR